MVGLEKRTQKRPVLRAHGELAGGNGECCEGDRDNDAAGRALPHCTSARLVSWN